MPPETTTLEEIQRNLHEIGNTKRILTNIDRLLREATYQGSKFPEISEAIGFLRHLARQAEVVHEQLKGDEKVAKKAAKSDKADEVSQEVVNDVASSDQVANG
jgi:hypothetical protein